MLFSASGVNRRVRGDGNVNQIAYRFHQGNQPTSQELAAIREQIAKMADVVLSALGKKL